jgi:predicted SprT family Zn-dependent metalloprotease
MEKWNMQVAIGELYKMFFFLNEKLYGNELPEPTLTIQSRGKHNALGWCTVNPIWVDKEQKDTRYEINICAEYANMEVIQIAEIILHEMAHLYGDIHEIKTTSRGGNFHNKEYKKLAEAHGLVVSKSKNNGFSETELNDTSKTLIAEANFSQESFKLARLDDEGKLNKKKGSIKHTCPNCGGKARTTKEMNLICKDCQTEMVIEEDTEQPEGD